MCRCAHLRPISNERGICSTNERGGCHQVRALMLCHCLTSRGRQTSGVPVTFGMCPDPILCQRRDKGEVAAQCDTEFALIKQKFRAEAPESYSQFTKGLSLDTLPADYPAPGKRLKSAAHSRRCNIKGAAHIPLSRLKTKPSWVPHASLSYCHLAQPNNFIIYHLL